MNMRRLWKGLVLIAAAAALLVFAAGRKTVLYIGFPCDSYWNAPGEDYYTFMDTAIARFEAEHPNVTVRYTSGIGVEDYSEWLSGRFLLGQEPDVMVILPEDFVQFSDAGALYGLDGLIAGDPEVDTADFYTAALESGADKGVQYALPLECVPQMMFINRPCCKARAFPSRMWTGHGTNFTACASGSPAIRTATACWTSSVCTIMAGRKPCWPTVVPSSARTAKNAC